MSGGILTRCLSCDTNVLIDTSGAAVDAAGIAEGLELVGVGSGGCDLPVTDQFEGCGPLALVLCSRCRALLDAAGATDLGADRPAAAPSARHLRSVPLGA